MDCAFTTTPAFWVDDYEQRFVISQKLSKPTVFYDILDTVVRAMMWPKLVDYSNDDCMRLLRKLGKIMLYKRLKFLDFSLICFRTGDLCKHSFHATCPW